MNILECCRHNKVDGLIYASSSSVYGGNEKIPFSVNDSVDKPVSIYAATKRANELMAYSYSQLYSLKTTGLRFFTAYGPWGRPDMAISIFTKKIDQGKTIDIFNYGKMKRDFTYINDVIDGLRLSIDKNFNCEIFNIGNSQSENIMRVVKILEQELGKKSIVNFKGMQKGDVKNTSADIQYSEEKLGFQPTIKIELGLSFFVKWYKEYYKN